MLFGKTDKVINTIHPVFENTISRANELNKLLDCRNQQPQAMLQFISDEVERLKHDLVAFVHVWKYGSVPTSQVFDARVRLSEVISDIEHKLLSLKDRGEDQANLTSFLYPELAEDTRKAERIEVFAGFEPMHPDDELPGISYGIKYIFADGTDRVHIFESSGDGCFESDRANDRRKRILNVVTAIAEDLLYKVHDDLKEAAKVDITIRTDIGIHGFYCPDGWSVKNGAESTPQKHHGHPIIPPKYFEHLIHKNMVQAIMAGEQVKVRIYSDVNRSEDHKKVFGVTREFGVKFIVGNVPRDILVFEEYAGDNPEVFVRKMNKVIALLDQFYFESVDMHPDIQMEIEVDFDQTGLLCPPNFVFVAPSLEVGRSFAAAADPALTV